MRVREDAVERIEERQASAVGALAEMLADLRVAARILSLTAKPFAARADQAHPDFTENEIVVLQTAIDNVDALLRRENDAA